jgi:hypothetical protein
MLPTVHGSSGSAVSLLVLSTTAQPSKILDAGLTDLIGKLVGYHH